MIQCLVPHPDRDGDFPGARFMILKTDDISKRCSPLELLEERHDFAGLRIVELGCGDAAAVKHLAAAYPTAHFTALEVDLIQHKKNLASSVPDNLTFLTGGAQAIPLEDESADLVIMLKSLHHVPVNSMDDALQEVARILRPGGCAHIAEPVFQGAFNDILRIFHDEEHVRTCAFEAVRKAVETGLLGLEEECFHLSKLTFASFEEFEERIIAVTHSQFDLDAEKMASTRRAFARYAGPDGARFEQPVRADILKKADSES